MTPRDEGFSDVVRRGFLRVEASLATTGPVVAREMGAWVGGLVPGDAPWTYMANVRSFPALYLPFFLETAIADAADPAFQEDLVASSIAGYLYIRLIDQVMDEREAPERRLLPALNVLHLAFLQPYQVRFPFEHPFHRTLADLWRLSAELTIRDEVHEDPDEAEYRFTTGRKNCAARIPLEAVLHRYDRPDLREPWTRFFEAFGAWHQMEDDVLDWMTDTNLGHVTYFLAEARRQSPAGAPPGSWILGEGLGWGFDTLARWWEDVLKAAQPLQSPGLDAYLAERAASHARLREDLFGPLARLRAMFQGIRT